MSARESLFSALNETLESPPGRWPVEEVAARWDAVEWYEREAWLRFGWRAAPWERAPDFAARILKADRKLTLERAAKPVVDFPRGL